MTKSMKIIHGLVILAILGFAFYWFQWRPTQIRKICAEEIQMIMISSGLRNEFYNECLNEHGLQK